MKKLVLCTTACVVLVGILFSQEVTVTQPNAGSEWMKGKTHTIQWRSAGKVPAYVKLMIYSPESRRTQVIMKRSVNKGKFEWTVPRDLPPGNYEVHLSTVDGQLLARSKVFKILESAKTIRRVSRLRTSSVRSLTPLDPGIKEQQVRIEKNLNPRTRSRLNKMAESLYADMKRMPFSEFHQVVLNKARKEFPNASQEELNVAVFYSISKIDIKLREEAGKADTLSDMSQMSMIDLQDAMQKEAQLMQMLSNMMKAMHNTSMAIIRKMK
jgi:hypothetical protein